jgi:hypothetical protein
VISAAFMAFWSQGQHMSHISCCHQGPRQATRRITYGKILLIGEDKEDGVTELVLVKHALQLLASLDNTVTIVAVDNEDDALGVLEVMSPERTDLVLTTDIPHCELDVLVLDRLDVEA